MRFYFVSCVPGHSLSILLLAIFKGRHAFTVFFFSKISLWDEETKKDDSRGLTNRQQESLLFLKFNLEWIMQMHLNFATLSENEIWQRILDVIFSQETNLPFVYWWAVHLAEVPCSEVLPWVDMFLYTHIRLKIGLSMRKYLDWFSKKTAFGKFLSFLISQTMERWTIISF